MLECEFATGNAIYVGLTRVSHPDQIVGIRCKRVFDHLYTYMANDKYFYKVVMSEQDGLTLLLKFGKGIRETDSSYNFQNTKSAIHFDAAKVNMKIEKELYIEQQINVENNRQLENILDKIKELKNNLFQANFPTKEFIFNELKKIQLD